MTHPPFLSKAIRELYPHAMQWLHYPSEGKRALFEAYAALPPNSRSAYDSYVERTFRDQWGESVLAYRYRDRGERGMSVSTNRPEYLSPDKYSTYLVLPQHVLVHWAQPDMPLGGKAFGHEQEIILREDATPKRIGQQMLPNMRRNGKPAESAMLEIASRLQGWRGLDFFGANEVLTWYRGDVPAFAFRGPALRIETRLFRTDGMIPNRKHAFDIAMQRTLGLDAMPAPGGYGVDGGAGQTLSDPDAHYSEVFDALAGIIAELLGTESAHVTLMPSEGSPWNPGEKETTFWSAKKKRLLSGGPPKGLVEVEYEREIMLGVNPCMHSQVASTDDSTLAGGVYSARIPPTTLIATHCMSLDRAHMMGAAANIRACGGLLFPSMAVGEIPATPFGPLCLVFRLGLVLDGLAPYKRGRGAWPVVVYKTDAWTGGTSQFVQGAAIVLFQQLTGAWEAQPEKHAYGVMHAHEWVLGPSLSESGFMGHEVDIIKNTKQLTQAAGGRAKLWKRDVTPAKMAQLSERIADRYPYLEAKSAAVVPLSEAPIALAPKMLERDAQKFLREAGWEGTLILTDTPKEWEPVFKGEWPPDKDVVDYRYAWLLRDAIVEYANKRGLFAPVRMS